MTITRRSAEQAFEAMEHEVVYLTALVGDLNQASAAPQDRADLPVERIDLATLINHAVRRLRARAAECGITLTTAIPLRVPAVRADGQGVHRLLANLLDNSLRHTPVGGTIRVRVTTEYLHTDGPRLVIQVCDSGVGIAPDHLPHIFERLYRASPGRCGQHGLGLSIAAAIVAAHAGTITVESQVGVGTVVTVCMPLDNP